MCRSTSHTRKIIPQAAAIPGFQTEMATKRQNLRTAALNSRSIILLFEIQHIWIYLFAREREVCLGGLKYK